MNTIFFAIVSVPRHLCFTLVGMPIQTIALTSPPLWGLVLHGCGYQGKTKMAGDRNNRQKLYSFVIAELKIDWQSREQ